MLKQAFTILLLIAFSIQTFYRVFIVADFYKNQDKIAKTLCENKARPKLHCNGKCQLAKKLQQEEKKDQNNPERKLENKYEVFLSKPDHTLPLNNSTIIETFYATTKNGSLSGFTSDCFHPPTA